MPALGATRALVRACRPRHMPPSAAPWQPEFVDGYRAAAGRHFLHSQEWLCHRPWHKHSCLCLAPDPDTWEQDGRERDAPRPAGKTWYSLCLLSSAMPMAPIFHAADACAAAWSTCSGGRVSASAAAVPAWGLGLLAPNSPFSTSDPELCASKTFFVSPDAGCRSSESVFSPPESCPSASDSVIPALDAGLGASTSAFAASDSGLRTSDSASRTVCPLPLVLAFTGSGLSVSPLRF